MRSVSPLCVCVPQPGPPPSGPPAHWFHTLQAPRLRGRRGRSNSDPLGGEDGVQDAFSRVRRKPCSVSTCPAGVLLLSRRFILNCGVSSAQKPGLQFGAAHSYVSLEKLGEGAYASVYKGVSRYSGRGAGPEAGSSQRHGSVPAAVTSCGVSDVFRLFRG